MQTQEAQLWKDQIPLTQSATVMMFTRRLVSHGANLPYLLDSPNSFLHHSTDEKTSCRSELALNLEDRQTKLAFSCGNWTLFFPGQSLVVQSSSVQPVQNWELSQVPTSVSKPKWVLCLYVTSLWPPSTRPVLCVKYVKWSLWMLYINPVFDWYWTRALLDIHGASQIESHHIHQ